jgi:cystathionine beta-lyase/cystathionine gamma-synthase
MVKAFPSKTRIGSHMLHPETLMLNYGYDPQLSEGAVKPPVFLTSTFVFRTAEDGQDFFDFVAGRREPPEGTGRTIHPTCASDKAKHFGLDRNSENQPVGPLAILPMFCAFICFDK